MPIESLAPGDRLLSLAIPGLTPDADWQAQYDWRSETGLDGTRTTAAPVGQVTLGTHNGFFVVNRRLKVTFEHPMLVRRGDEWGFCAAELLRIGDRLVHADASEEAIDSIEHIAAPARTVSLHIPGTNTYLAEGVWTHNDMAKTGGSGGGAIGSGSGGSSDGGSGSGSVSGSGSDGKSSGSSFASSSSGGGSSEPQSVSSAQSFSSTLV